LISLLRLLEMQDGRIEVDGVDLSRLPRALIRQRCFITIAQEAFLFPGASMRFNLDPSGRLPDTTLIYALEMTGLWAIFRGTVSSGVVNGSAEFDDHDNVFDKPLTSLPELSVGQTQLFALARAILQMRVASNVRGADFADYPSQQRKPIVLLDEATSSLDPETEAKMYDVIQEHFINSGHTVIMVTHKLGLFADRMRQGRDKVVWMRDGMIERVGDMDDLLKFSQPAS
jgi:ATP-binding cassette, subfamily C (CFTR/MRP), member 1